MRHAIIPAFILSITACGDANAQGGKFDGVWDTTVSCKNTQGALGFAYDFPSTVKHGSLSGEKGTKDEPGWFQLQGEIHDDGLAKLYAKGLVGASQFAVGGRPAGTGYGYHVDAAFTGDQGSGKRVEGRPCEVSFVRRK